MTGSQSSGGRDRPERTLDVRSWEFWKRRLGRALIVGALALAVTQLLPALPRDQRVEVHAPRGASLRLVQLTYFQDGDEEPLASSRLTPAEPTSHLPHTIRLPDGNYSIRVQAEGTSPSGAPRLWQTTSEVAFTDGERRSIQLAP